LRRIANRLAGISMGRILAAPPPLDDTGESAREAVLASIRSRLESWLEFFEASPGLSATRAAPAGDSRTETTRALNEFSGRLEAQDFAPVSAWTLQQRRAILAELQSMRRLHVLMFELDRYLAGVARPQNKFAPAPEVR
jgi:hypothetical protein